MAVHLGHIESVVDLIAMAGPIKGPSAEHVVGGMLVFRADDLRQDKGLVEGVPYERCDIWEAVEWSGLVLAAGSAAGDVTG